MFPSGGYTLIAFARAQHANIIVGEAARAKALCNSPRSWRGSYAGVGRFNLNKFAKYVFGER